MKLEWEVRLRLPVSQPYPTQHDIVCFGPRARTRTSQTVTHPNTTPTQARLTPEFLQDPGLHGFKTHHVWLRRDLTYKPRVRT